MSSSTGQSGTRTITVQPTIVAQLLARSEPRRLTLELQHSVALFAATARFYQPLPRGRKLRRLDEALDVKGLCDVGRQCDAECIARIWRRQRSIFPQIMSIRSESSERPIEAEAKLYIYV